MEAKVKDKNKINSNIRRDDLHPQSLLQRPVVHRVAVRVRVRGRIRVAAVPAVISFVATGCTASTASPRRARVPIAPRMRVLSPIAVPVLRVALPLALLAALAPLAVPVVPLPLPRPLALAALRRRAATDYAVDLHLYHCFRVPPAVACMLPARTVSAAAPATAPAAVVVALRFLRERRREAWRGSGRRGPLWLGQPWALVRAWLGRWRLVGAATAAAAAAFGRQRGRVRVVR